MVLGVGTSSSKSTNFAKNCTKTDRPTSKSSKEITISALIVDDDPLIRRIHKVFLSKSGFETHEVEDGKQAVNLFRSGSCFDLIVMDRDMPIMDGLEVSVFSLDIIL